MSTFAHEEYNKAIQLSNLHLKVMVGFEESLQLDIAESYASLINDFIQEIDSTQKIFIQFEEDYCGLGDEYYLLSVDTFKNVVTPLGFPFSYKYNLGYIKTEYGLTILISNSNFEINPILNLISYGLENIEAIKEGQKYFTLEDKNLHPITMSIARRDYLNRIKTIVSEVIDSIFENEDTNLETKYLTKKVYLLNHSFCTLDILLKNDTIEFENKAGESLLKIDNLYFLKKDESSNSWFVFDTEKSFYFTDCDTDRISTLNHLTFSVKNMCEAYIFIEYNDENRVFKLSSSYMGRDGKVDYLNRETGLIIEGK